MKHKVFFSFFFTAVCMFATSQYGLAASAPPQAATVGYTQNTFSSTFTNDIDLNNTRAPGYHWYLNKFFGWPPTQPSSLHFNSDGSLTLTSGGSTANFAISSAADSGKPAPNDWVGTAFGGGGYFEAEFKFDPSFVMKPGAVGFPAWWLGALEHAHRTPHGAQWKGQVPGFEHYIEVDIFEYNQWKNHPFNVYSGAVHDWYGIHNQTCPGKAYCDATNYNNTTRFSNYLISTPTNTDFRQYHKYGVLWVPATKTSQGYLQYYFDGKPTNDRVSWSLYDEQAHRPLMLQTASQSTPWVFGILDRQHLILILGTGNGQPMTIKDVNVWQKNADQNLKQ